MSDEMKKDDNVVEEVEFVQDGDKTEEPKPDKSWSGEQLQAELKKREEALNSAVEEMNKLRKQYNQLSQIVTVTRGAIAQLKELLK